MRLLQAAALALVCGVLLGRVGGHAPVARALDYSHLTTLQKRLLSGFAELTLNPAHANDRGAQVQGATQAPGAAPSTTSPAAGAGCRPGGLGSDVVVNQNCLNLSDGDLQGRGQAENETAIAVGPRIPSHFIAGYNDYRRGDGNCGSSYWLNSGTGWNDALPPMGFTRGGAFNGADREYWEAGGDPAVAFDTRGNAYFQCMVFQRGNGVNDDGESGVRNGGVTNNPDASSAIYVFRATQNAGDSWDFPGRPVFEQYDTTGNVLEDKPYMAVDDRGNSPFRDRIYVSWTEFAADGSAYIWESHSNDYGQTFSPRVLVSGDSTLC